MKFQFFVFISIVVISGLSQGMMLPLIAIIFEQEQISPTLNGLHATSAALGVLVISPFLEKPLRKFGFKPMILVGGGMVVVAFVLFPIFHSYLFWFLLRFMIGVGDHALHFASQTWVTENSPASKRGRNIALYGFSFGIGFAIGPLLTNLLHFGHSVPFLSTAMLTMIGLGAIYLTKNSFPTTADDHSETFISTIKRMKLSWNYAYVALLLPFAYGFLEAILNVNFPVFAVREEMSIEKVSLLLATFATGGILFQLPLGMLTDKFDRRKMIFICMFIGILAFLASPFFIHSPLLFVFIFIAGMFVGSLFSMGLTYMTDLLPTELLPAGNLMCGILYSVGSIAGPFLGGTAIQHGVNVFLVIVVVLTIVGCAGAIGRRTRFSV